MPRGVYMRKSKSPEAKPRSRIVPVAPLTAPTVAGTVTAPRTVSTVTAGGEARSKVTSPTMASTATGQS